MRKSWIVIALILALNPFSTSYARGSGYYEIPLAGRPRDAFSLCCCKKESENTQEVYYSCNYSEERECPNNTKKYETLNDCPNGLMYTKY